MSLNLSSFGYEASHIHMHDLFNELVSLMNKRKVMTCSEYGALQIG